MFSQSKLIRALFIVLLGLGGGIFGSFFYYTTLAPQPTAESGPKESARSFLRERIGVAGLYSPNDVSRLNTYASGSIATLFHKKQSASDILDAVYPAHEELGHGFVLTADGWVIVHPALAKRLTLETTTVNIGSDFFPVSKIVIDQTRNIAYIKIAAENLGVLKFADSDDIRFGDQFFVIAGKNKVAAGIVSSLSGKEYSNRASLIDSSEISKRFVAMQPALHSEFLGAPVMNLNGEVLGIIFRTDASGESLMLPINTLRASVRELLGGEKFTRVYLGISYLDLNEERVEGKDYQNGFLIYENASLGIKGILKGSPAEAALLRPGDRIIRMNDIDIRGPLKFSELLDNFEPGDIITLGIVRDGKEMNLKVTLGKK